MTFETEKHEAARGRLLRILAPDHPDYMDSVMLRNQLDIFGYPVTDKTLNSYVAYLAERGYVKVEERKTALGVIRMIAITANGLDLIDERKDDSGVDVRM